MKGAPINSCLQRNLELFCFPILLRHEQVGERVTVECVYLTEHTGTCRPHRNPAKGAMTTRPRSIGPCLIGPNG